MWKRYRAHRDDSATGMRLRGVLCVQGINRPELPHYEETSSWVTTGKTKVCLHYTLGPFWQFLHTVRTPQMVAVE